MEKRLPSDQIENVPKEIPNRPNPDKEYPIKNPVPDESAEQKVPDLDPEIPDVKPGKDNPINPETDEPDSK